MELFCAPYAQEMMPIIVLSFVFGLGSFDSATLSTGLHKLVDFHHSKMKGDDICIEYRNFLSYREARGIKNMATSKRFTMSVSTTSPKGVAGAGESDEAAQANSSPKGQCLCSPTTHKGSFRCRIHRSQPNVFKRSNSMAAAKTSVSPKTVKSANES